MKSQSVWGEEYKAGLLTFKGPWELGVLSLSPDFTPNSEYGYKPSTLPSRTQFSICENGRISSYLPTAEGIYEQN